MIYISFREDIYPQFRETQAAIVTCQWHVWKELMLSSGDDMYVMYQDSAKTNILLILATKSCKHISVMDRDCTSTLPCSCYYKLSPVISMKSQQRHLMWWCWRYELWVGVVGNVFHLHTPSSFSSISSSYQFILRRWIKTCKQRKYVGWAGIRYDRSNSNLPYLICTGQFVFFKNSSAGFVSCWRYTQAVLLLICPGGKLKHFRTTSHESHKVIKWCFIFERMPVSRENSLNSDSQLWEPPVITFEMKIFDKLSERMW